MTIHSSSAGIIELEGDCPLEDAEVLQRHLLHDENAAIDWHACTYAHSSVVQVLMIAKRAMHGVPASVFLGKHVAPILEASRV